MTTLNDQMNKEVEGCTPSDRLGEVVDRMAEQGLEFMPVCDGEKLVGTLTARDMMLSGAVGKRGYRLPVKKVMNRRPPVAKLKMTPEQALRQMEKRHTRWLPVVDKGKYIGLITLADLAVMDGMGEEVGEVLSQTLTPNPPRIQPFPWKKAIATGMMVTGAVALWMMQRSEQPK
ncbi:CBS domain-containing protein [Marininema halotolerans]|uniref:CBS domain-containing protein n=1 Tax=Marininema halotolerans TaxID=1155944 RepID=A0A1I6RN83_9BACL|nr:CBS domain-containing protein [Marininema halotolerans]SFS66096.1 CBS domain-containing protein [Marininema halotolerans]